MIDHSTHKHPATFAGRAACRKTYQREAQIRDELVSIAGAVAEIRHLHLAQMDALDRAIDVVQERTERLKVELNQIEALR